ncbi:YecH family metal-binding protein [Parendozoicomonas haliclonae]|uniref:Metal-binding protein n=1 Tax=Parendozoicomonas haliclonae TaxID=1960125 RepID=A0A1X7AM69_9GAMM|nr:YecH family metal-binding protein [Parendozoicomonas haliclonae]SMA49338.1 hypothetical protein EHSB41UT_03191 [Parendozoicomonas haliclonae]
MARTVHGRKVLMMVLESGRHWPRAELVQEMADKFGADSTFHTCSVQALSANDLIDLFVGKGKMVESDEGLFIDAGKMCSGNHAEGHRCGGHQH